MKNKKLLTLLSLAVLTSCNNVESSNISDGIERIDSSSLDASTSYISLEKYMTLQDEKNRVLEQKIKSLEEAIAAFEERTTKLMTTVSNAATTALQVAQNQSIQIETINQEVFK